MTNQILGYNVLHNSEGFALIRLNPSGLYNFLTVENKLLTDESFLDAGPFENGFACIQRLDGKYYFIRNDGKIIPENNGFDGVWKFEDGFGRVRISENEYNFLKPDGTLLSNENYDDAEDFCNGFAEVYCEGKGCNYLKKDGTLLSRTYFPLVKTIKKYGLRFVFTEKNRWAILNEDGTIHNFAQNVSYVDDFSEGFATFSTDANMWNYIDSTGKIISEQWYLKTYPFKNGFGIIKRSVEEYNFMTRNGNPLCKEWFPKVHNFYHGVAVVGRSDGTFNFITPDGTFMSSIWFDSAGDFNRDGIASVTLNGKCYHYTIHGNMSRVDID